MTNKVLVYSIKLPRLFLIIIYYNFFSSDIWVYTFKSSSLLILGNPQFVVFSLSLLHRDRRSKKLILYYNDHNSPQKFDILLNGHFVHVGKGNIKNCCLNQRTKKKGLSQQKRQNYLAVYSSLYSCLSALPRSQKFCATTLNT